MAVPVYAGLAHFVVLPMPDKPPASQLVTNLLFGLGFISILLGFWIASLLPESGISIGNSENKLDSVTAKMLVGDAFFESTAIYGLVGSVLGMPAQQCDLLFLISFVLLAIQAIRIRNQFS